MTDHWQTAALKPVLREAGRYKIPLSAIAKSALQDFVWPCPTEDGDFDDPNDVMISRAFERALSDPNADSELAAWLRHIRNSGTGSTIFIPRRAVTNPGVFHETLSAGDGPEIHKRAHESVARVGPIRRFEQRFLVCLAFSYLYDRGPSGRLPTQREVLDYINERPEKPNSEESMALSSLQAAGKFLQLKFGHATYNSAQQKRLDRETIIRAARASLE
jgi:hypothetical protein